MEQGKLTNDLFGKEFQKQLKVIADQGKNHAEALDILKQKAKSTAIIFFKGSRK